MCCRVVLLNRFCINYTPSVTYCHALMDTHSLCNHGQALHCQHANVHVVKPQAYWLYREGILLYNRHDHPMYEVIDIFYILLIRSMQRMCTLSNPQDYSTCIRCLRTCTRCLRTCTCIRCLRTCTCIRCLRTCTCICCLRTCTFTHKQCMYPIQSIYMYMYNACTEMNTHEVIYMYMTCTCTCTEMNTHEVIYMYMTCTVGTLPHLGPIKAFNVMMGHWINPCLSFWL